MEKISDILDSIKDRISNPFFISFIIAWIFWNWDIVIVLIWYDNQQLAATDDKSILGFVCNHSDSWKSIGAPILSALTYTILLTPLLRNIAMLVTTQMDKTGNKLNFDISKGTHVGFDKYLDLKRELDKEKSELATSINEKNESEAKRKELDVTILKLTTENTDFKKQLIDEKQAHTSDISRLSIDHERELHEAQNRLQALSLEYEKFIHSLNEVDFMNGEWEVTYTFDKRKVPGYFHILGRMMKNKQATNEWAEDFTIENFWYDSINKKIFFVKSPARLESSGIAGSVVIRDRKGNNVLVMLEVVGDELIGTESFKDTKTAEKVEVRYKRVQAAAGPIVPTDVG